MSSVLDQPLRLPIRSSNVMLSPERHRLQTFMMKRTARCRTETMHIKDGTRKLEAEIPLPLGITCEQFDSPRLLKLGTSLKWLTFPPQADLLRVKASNLESGNQFLRQHPKLEVWGRALSHPTSNSGLSNLEIGCTVQIKHASTRIIRPFEAFVFLRCSSSRSQNSDRVGQS